MFFVERYPWTVCTLIFVICTKCVCADIDIYSDSRAENDGSTSSEEMIRRRKVAESYLAEMSAGRKDWVETYHNDYFPNKVSSNQEEEKSNFFLSYDEIDDSLGNQNAIAEMKDSKRSSKISEEEFKRRRNICGTFSSKLKDLEHDRYKS